MHGGLSSPPLCPLAVLLLLVDSILGQAYAKYSCPPNWAVIGLSAALPPGLGLSAMAAFDLTAKPSHGWGGDLFLGILSPLGPVKAGETRERDGDEGVETDLEMGHKAATVWLFCPYQPQAVALPSGSCRICQ